jgi:hypothetical protein
MAEKPPYEYYVSLVTLMGFLSLSSFADKEKFVAQTVIVKNTVAHTIPGS